MSKFANAVLATIGTLIFSVMFAVIIIEWMAGCGETYIAADGKRYSNECVFINQK